MKVRAVVDTNVVISGVLRPASKPGFILDAMLEEVFNPVASVELLEEYREVLLRPKFGFDPSLVEALADGLEAVSSIIVPTPQDKIRSDDPKDQFIIDLGIDAHAPIVTGNVRYFASYPDVMTPAAFVEKLREQS